MQKRKLAGGLVAAGVLIGAYFSGMFSKFGTGTGTGNGTGTGATPVVASTRATNDGSGAALKTPPTDPKKSTTDAKPTAAAPSTSATQTSAQAPVAASAQPERRAMPEKFPVLDVYVKERSYEIKDPVSGAMLRVLLPDVLLLAKRTTGDENGLRVRINRYRSAKVVGWSQLCSGLEAAGFEREKDFVMPHEMIEVAQAKPQTETPAPPK